jgi:hypothetical protein
VTEIAPVLTAIAAELPGPRFSTDELLAAATGRFSDRLVEMLAGLGIGKRHSVLSNYPQVLFQGEDPKLDIATADLAVRSARAVLAKADAARAGRRARGRVRAQLQFGGVHDDDS